MDCLEQSPSQMIKEKCRIMRIKHVDHLVLTKKEIQILVSIQKERNEEFINLIEIEYINESNMTIEVTMTQYKRSCHQLT